VAALITSAVAGIAVIHLPPLLLLGAVACALAVYIVLTRPFVGLVLYTCAFLLRPGAIFPVLQTLHIERVLGVLAFAGMYLEQHRTSGRILIDGTRQTRLLLLFVVPVLLSIPLAYWPSVAVHGLIEFLKVLVWYLLVVHLLNTPLRLRIYLSFFLTLVCYIAFDAFAAYCSGSAAFAQGIDRAEGQTGAGGNPNTLAATMAATIPVLLLLTFHKGLRWFRLLPAAGTFLLAVTMSVTGSRSGLLGFLGGLLFLWWGCRHRLLVGFLGASILVVGFLVLPDQYKTRYVTISSTELDGSSRSRVELWKRGLRMMSDRPLTGVGIGCFRIANAADYSTESWRSNLVAHSLYVQVAAETGVGGALVFFAFLFAVLRLNGRTARELGAAGASWRFEAVVLRGLAAGVFVLLITGVFGSSLLRHTWYVYAALGAAVTRLYADHSLSGGVAGVAIRNENR
jgi:O-antigen ligase